MSTNAAVVPPSAYAFSIAVYCGARTGHAPHFEASARAVGQWIGSHGGRLVYGGGNAGLMGVVAQNTLQAGGQVYGVIPESLAARELANRDCTELHVVRDMHERKSMMANAADAFLAIPGGVGTMDELFEIWGWRHLGYHQKPVGLLNCHGFYDELINFIHTARDNGFIDNNQINSLDIDHDAQALLAKLIAQIPNKPTQASPP